MPMGPKIVLGIIAILLPIRAKHGACRHHRHRLRRRPEDTDPDLLRSSMLGTDLGDGFFGLIALPLLALLLGVVGNAINQAGQAFRQEYARS